MDRGDFCPQTLNRVTLCLTHCSVQNSADKRCVHFLKVRFMTFVGNRANWCALHLGEHGVSNHFYPHNRDNVLNNTVKTYLLADPQGAPNSESSTRTKYKFAHNRGVSKRTCSGIPQAAAAPWIRHSVSVRTRIMIVFSLAGAWSRDVAQLRHDSFSFPPLSRRTVLWLSWSPSSRVSLRRRFASTADRDARSGRCSVNLQSSDMKL